MNGEHDDIEYDGKDWDPNHPLLKLPGAPHETAGVLRIKNTGMPGNDLMKLWGLRATTLMNQLQKGLDQVQLAGRLGLPIHDALMPKGTV
ncbi:hypothetical protein ACWF99_23770 [Nocardia sp. NPDC055002]